MQELKNMKIWVLWRYTRVRGKITKVPFAASGGPSGADEKFRNTWVSYEEIQRAASSAKCDGIGFILPCGARCQGCYRRFHAGKAGLSLSKRCLLR